MRFKKDLRPDAWMDWTSIEEGETDARGPILDIRQHGHVVHLSLALAGELEATLKEWRGKHEKVG